MKKIKVAINGLGRIGRYFFKLALKNELVEIVAINDIADIENIVYLLKYDSAQKNFNLKIESEIISEDEKYLKINNQKIPYYSFNYLTDLPWDSLEVDVVAECTGIFNTFEKSQEHLKAGAKRVVLSGPTKDQQDTEFENGKFGTTILTAINDDNIEKYRITSNGSCTTNAVTLALKLLDEEFKIESALMNTIHAYTTTQNIIDGPVPKGRDLRRGRAAAQNIIPTSTGSSQAVPKVYPKLAGKFEATAVRVPIISGSLINLNFVTKKEISTETINELFKTAEKKYSLLLKTTNEPLVSTDIIGDTHAAIIDLNFTKTKKQMGKLFIWYDNEAGYSQTLLNHIIKMGQSIN